MKRAGDLIPWKVTDISLRPYSHFWSFNPSIHFDGKLWRCSLRCADYCMRGGETIRSPRSKPGESWTKNVMVIFDPTSWKPVEIYKMRERDGLKRGPCTSVGYEDVRIFQTDKGGLQGIAASLHLWRDACQQSQRAEQVLLSFDAEYNVTSARPIRGAWGTAPQKNWVPFDNCAEPCFLYSIGDGTLFNERGPLALEEAWVRSSAGEGARGSEPGRRARRRAEARAAKSEDKYLQDRPELRGSDKGRRYPDFPWAYSPLADLRGGTQLVCVGDDAWLGIGHAMRFVDGLKCYWHVWYLVDARGKMKSASPPMKLASNGIEFAAGLAIVGDRVVVSFGVDDMECKVGETKLSAVLEVLQRSATVR